MLVLAVFFSCERSGSCDLGIYKPGDVTILLSKSGSSEEIVRILPIIKDLSQVIAILGRVESPIGESADVILDASVEKEADSLNLLPTASVQ